MTVYASNDALGHAVLKCERCPDWEVDIDGASVADVLKRADEHERDHDAAAA